MIMKPGAEDTVVKRKIHHYVIKFISDFRQVRGFVLGTLLSSTNKTDLHDMTKTLLKVALYPITLNLALVA
jgi:2-keto-4-pentenoate hydratase